MCPTDVYLSSLSATLTAVRNPLNQPDISVRCLSSYYISPPPRVDTTQTSQCFIGSVTCSNSAGVKRSAAMTMRTSMCEIMLGKNDAWRHWSRTL